PGRMTVSGEGGTLIVPPATLGPVNAMEMGHVALSGRQGDVRGAVTGWPPVQAVRGRMTAGQRNPSSEKWLGRVWLRPVLRHHSVTYRHKFSLSSLPRTQPNAAWPISIALTGPRSLRGSSHLLLECATIPCMTFSYLPYHPDQAHLLPVSASDWLPEGHLAYFIADTVE